MLGGLALPAGGGAPGNVSLTPQVQQQVTDDAAAAAAAALTPTIAAKLDKGPSDNTPRVVQNGTLAPVPPATVSQADKDAISTQASTAAQTALAPTIAAKADATALNGLVSDVSASGADLTFTRQGTAPKTVSVTATVSQAQIDTAAAAVLPYKTPLDFGAIGDGTAHTAAEWLPPTANPRFASFAALQAVYPHATGSSDYIDWLAIQALLNAGVTQAYIKPPPGGGHYVINRALLPKSGTRIYGDGYASYIRNDESNSTSVHRSVFAMGAHHPTVWNDANAWAHTKFTVAAVNAGAYSATLSGADAGKGGQFQVGKFVWLRSTGEGTTSGNVIPYYQQLCKIRASSGDTISFDDPVERAIASPVLAKIDQAAVDPATGYAWQAIENVTLEGLRLKGRNCIGDRTNMYRCVLRDLWLEATAGCLQINSSTRCTYQRIRGRFGESFLEFKNGSLRNTVEDCQGEYLDTGEVISVPPLSTGEQAYFTTLRGVSIICGEDYTANQAVLRLSGPEFVAENLRLARKSDTPTTEMATISSFSGAGFEYTSRGWQITSLTCEAGAGAARYLKIGSNTNANNPRAGRVRGLKCSGGPAAALAVWQDIPASQIPTDADNNRISGIDIVKADGAAYPVHRVETGSAGPPIALDDPGEVQAGSNAQILNATERFNAYPSWKQPGTRLNERTGAGATATLLAQLITWGPGPYDVWCSPDGTVARRPGIGIGGGGVWSAPSGGVSSLTVGNPATKPAQLLWGNSTKLIENTTTPATPAAGQWGWSGGAIYVNLDDSTDPDSLAATALRYVPSGITPVEGPRVQATPLAAPADDDFVVGLASGSPAWQRLESAIYIEREVEHGVAFDISPDLVGSYDLIASRWWVEENKPLTLNVQANGATVAGWGALSVTNTRPATRTAATGSKTTSDGARLTATPTFTAGAGTKTVLKGAVVTRRKWS